MISPCYECTRRTAIPNCHAGCEAYAKYNEYRQKVREKRCTANAIRSMRVSRYIAKVQHNEKRT